MEYDVSITRIADGQYELDLANTATDELYTWQGASRAIAIANAKRDISQALINLGNNVGWRIGDPTPGLTEEEGATFVAGAPPYDNPIEVYIASSWYCMGWVIGDNPDEQIPRIIMVLRAWLQIIDEING